MWSRERYDSGIHLGEFIDRDMIAARASHHQRAANSPRDLLQLRCVNISMGSAGVYRWEFEKGS